MSMLDGHIAMSSRSWRKIRRGEGEQIFLEMAGCCKEDSQSVTSMPLSSIGGVAGLHHWQGLVGMIQLPEAWLQK